jgi:DNA polymerase-3 subunit delta'
MSFSGIKGQERALGILKTYIDNSSLEGGYLFSGPEGVGKKLSALALAKKLNCSENQSDSCGHCPSCLKISNNQHPDVHIISSEDPLLKIDAVRQLQKEINLKAYEGTYKVFIIDNAHTLTPEASNSLLKILEEPPKKSLIILISDKPNLLFKTVISRCKTIKFLPLKREELEGVLKRDYKLDNSFAHFLAYFSEGRLGRALKLKDEDIINKRNDLIDRFVLAANPSADRLALKNRTDVRDYLNLLATWFRDIYLLKTGISEREIINSDRRQDLLRGAESFSFADLDAILGNITGAISYLEMNVNTRLLMHNLGMELWKA